MWIRSKKFLHLKMDRRKVNKETKKKTKRREFLQGAKSAFVGKIQKSRNSAFFVTEDKMLPGAVFIPDELLHGAKNNDKVIVRIVDRTKKAKNGSRRLYNRLNYGKPIIKAILSQPLRCAEK